jgi:hypothetical protein
MRTEIAEVAIVEHDTETGRPLTPKAAICGLLADLVDGIRELRRHGSVGRANRTGSKE